MVRGIWRPPVYTLCIHGQTCIRIFKYRSPLLAAPNGSNFLPVPKPALLTLVPGLTLAVCNPARVCDRVPAAGVAGGRA